MNINHFLQLLKGVRQHSSGRWMACCPAHDDHSPSLSIREGRESQILVYCFAGCGADAVMSSVGLSLRDLYPEPIGHYCKSEKPNHYHAIPDVMRILEQEVRLVIAAAESVAAGVPISEADRDRVALAGARIQRCARMCI